MRSKKSVPHRRSAALPGALLALAVAACDGSEYRSPTAPAPPAAPAVSAELPDGYPNFQGDATVLSVTGQSPCSYSPRAGDREADHRWWVGVTERAFALSGDPVDGPVFEGEIQGRSFADDYHYGGDYLASHCQFREAWLSGVFSDDLNAFEAQETQIYGPPGNEFTVIRHHRARRR